MGDLIQEDDAFGAIICSLLVAVGLCAAVWKSCFTTQDDKNNQHQRMRRQKCAVMNSPSQEICLMLIGKTGHGKSSTGNSILMSKRFGISDSTDCSTKNFTCGSADVDGVKVNVIDTPGLCDLKDSHSERVIRNMCHCMETCPEGIDSFLFVLKYPLRTTEEERNVFEDLQMIFSKEIFKHCIIVFTNKGDFEEKHGTTKDAVTRWVDNNGGYIGSLLRLVQGRFIFFDNMEPSEEQRLELLEMVRDINAENGRYARELFQSAKNKRELLKLRKKQQEIERKNDQIILHFCQVREKFKNNHDDRVEKLKTRYSNSLVKEDAHLSKITSEARKCGYEEKTFPDLVDEMMKSFTEDSELAFQVECEELKEFVTNDLLVQLEELIEFSRRVKEYDARGEDTGLSTLSRTIDNTFSEVTSFLGKVELKQSKEAKKKKFKRVVKYGVCGVVSIASMALSLPLIPASVAGFGLKFLDMTAKIWPGIAVFKSPLDAQQRYNLVSKRDDFLKDLAKSIRHSKT